MLRNASGASPFVHRIVFNSEVSVFVSAEQDKNVKVYVDEHVVFQGKVGENSRIISGIYVSPNQDVRVEVEDGGDVFLSILEENVKMIGGVSVASISYLADGQTTIFPLPASNAPAHTRDEVMVSIHGVRTETFSLTENKENIQFNEGAPFINARIDITLTKPQD